MQLESIPSVDRSRFPAPSTPYWALLLQPSSLPEDAQSWAHPRWRFWSHPWCSLYTRKSATLPEGWEKYYHPKGRFPYFFHHPSHLLTDLDLLNPHLSKETELVYAVATDHAGSIPEGWDQVFNPPVKHWEMRDDWRPSKFFVDHNSRVLTQTDPRTMTTMPINMERVQLWRGICCLDRSLLWNWYHLLVGRVRCSEGILGLHDRTSVSSPLATRCSGMMIVTVLPLSHFNLRMMLPEPLWNAAQVVAICIFHGTLSWLSNHHLLPDSILHSGNDSPFTISECDTLLSIIKDFSCACISSRV